MYCITKCQIFIQVQCSVLLITSTQKDKMTFTSSHANFGNKQSALRPKNTHQDRTILDILMMR